MRGKTFPKENQKKLNQTVSDLKAELRQRNKEIKFLREEIQNLTKPVRERKLSVEQQKPTLEEWKKDFIHRFKRDVLGENNDKG